MKRILNTLLISAVSALMLSCTMEDYLSMPKSESIVIDLSSGVTKATVKEDSEEESFVNHIDVFIFEDNDGSPDARKSYGRYQLNNASQMTLNAQRSDFGENAYYHVYLVANSNIAESDFEAVKSYDDFVGMKQTDELLHLTGINAEGAPKYFLMDAKAGGSAGSGSAVILNNGNDADDTVLSATLRRAAAKVVINIKAGPNVEFRSYPKAADGTMVSDGGLYYIQNLPYQAFLLAEARPDDTIDATVVNVKNTDRGYDGHFIWDPAKYNKDASLVTYVYPNSWTSDIINRETCAVVNIPLAYTPEEGQTVEHHNSWYKIHMTGEKLFRRNNYYEVNVTINRPGATSETVPVELKDVYFKVQDWAGQTINVGGDDKPSYLQLNKNHVDIYNVNTDASSLEFASSSPITSIVLDRAYYVNYLGQEVDVEDANRNVYNAIKATAQPGVLNGNITIFSPFVAGDGFSKDSHSNAIRYMTFTVTNQDGKTQTFTVNQYPTLYITHEMGHYSYRSDFQGTNINGVGTENISGASWTGNGWQYSSTASSSVFFGSKVALGNEGNYTINYAYWGTQSSGGSGWPWGPGNNNNNDNDGELRLITSQFNGLYNPRMYHIHVMATSSQYTVARPRMDGNYTDSSAENARLVSPSFMAASQLGATQQLSGGIDQAKAHCEQYIEVTADGVEYSDWRLPTAAEIDIIIAHQEVSDAMATILTEGAYYCAYNPDDGTYTRKTGKSSSTTPVRCVRDAY